METRKGMMIAAFALSAAVMGQGFGSIEGKLLDENGDPVPFVSVTAGQGGNSWSATSDIDGRFTVKPLPAGEYSVRLVAFNVDLTKDGIVVLPDDITRMGELRLQDAQNLPTLVIVRERYVPPMIEHDNTGVTKVFHKQFTNNPNKVDPVKMIASFVPGVVQAPRGDGLYFRGARAENMCYFVDGVKLGSTLSGVPNEAINSFSVYTGGVPAKYGDVTGGIVAIETKSYFDLYQQRNAGVQ
jgi:hypothetical protein